MIRLPVEDEKRVLLSEGPHLFRILSAALAHKKDKPILKLRLEVIQGPTPAGTQSVEELYLTPDAIKRVSILAKRLGLIPRGTPDLEIDLDEQQFVGLHVVAVIGHEGFTNNKNELVTISKWQGFADFWAPDDEKSPLRPNSFATPGTRPAAVPAGATDWSNV